LKNISYVNAIFYSIISLLRSIVRMNVFARCCDIVGFTLSKRLERDEFGNVKPFCASHLKAKCIKCSNRESHLCMNINHFDERDAFKLCDEYNSNYDRARDHKYRNRDYNHKSSDKHDVDRDAQWISNMKVKFGYFWPFLSDDKHCHGTARTLSAIARTPKAIDEYCLHLKATYGDNWLQQSISQDNLFLRNLRNNTSLRGGRQPIQDDRRQPIQDDRRQPIQDDRRQPIQDDRRQPIQSMQGSLQTSYNRDIKRPRVDNVQNTNQPDRMSYDEYVASFNRTNMLPVALVPPPRPPPPFAPPRPPQPTCTRPVAPVAPIVAPVAPVAPVISTPLVRQETMPLVHRVKNTPPTDPRRKPNSIIQVSEDSSRVKGKVFFATDPISIVASPINNQTSILKNNKRKQIELEEGEEGEGEETSIVISASPFKCKHCPSTFATLTDRATHIKAKHETVTQITKVIEQLQCMYCRTKCISEHGLKIHRGRSKICGTQYDRDMRKIDRVLGQIPK